MNLLDPNLYSFAIMRFFTPRLFKTMVLPLNVPMRQNLLCPADETALRTICTFIGHAGKQRMRVGCCPMCGYVGYIDRPPPEWMDSYYRDRWDDAPAKNIEELIMQYRNAGGRVSSKLCKLFASIPADKSRPVLEIGCGYGKDLKGIGSLGYNKLVGVEHSTHRAEVARKAFDLNVCVGPFEGDTVQAELQTHAPFSVIFSNQVLEHVYDIAKVIEACSRLQNENDYLAIAMPNAVGEVSGITLLYIPHLHGLTPVSLENLLGRFGYRVVDGSRTSSVSNIVIAQKYSAPYQKKETPLAFQATLSKFSRGLGFGEAHNCTPRLLWFFRRMDYGGQEPAWSRALMPLQWLCMNHWLWRRRYRAELIAHAGEEKYRNHTAHVSSIVCAAIEDVGRRYTTYEESPLEIQFESDISFLCK